MQLHYLILALFYVLNAHIFKVTYGADNSSIRLPNTITPDHYKLKVLTHLNDAHGFQYKGDVFIKLNVHENTKRITLHAKGLNIHVEDISIALIDGNNSTSGDNLTVVGTDAKESHDFFSIDVADELIKGNRYLLFIPFNASLSEGLSGYYRSSYKSRDSKNKTWLAVTQFEPTYARQAFPCFDEPALKSKFEISVGHHKSYTALSNMPVVKTEPIDTYQKDWIIDHFEESVSMSTYLVAYIVFDFKSKDAALDIIDNVIFKTWARGDILDQAEYANFVGPNVLKFYEEYFDIKYPLPKLDMVAIPDFSAGAMENWGLVTYREAALLYQPNISSTNAKAGVASVIAHELAHQWFGNLVTMEWWTDLWLNEGFATYVASLGIRKLHPEWNSFAEESLDNTLRIFEFDALKSSHPVSVVVNHPDEIAQIFDFISYSKGSSIIRMMHLFLGEEVFREGVSNYLKKFKYCNANQNDLWDALTESAHKHEVLSEDITVKKIMDTWTLQTGYPVIKVERDYEANTAVITQKRFLSANIKSRTDQEACWWIPLSFTTSDDVDFNSTVPTEWLKCDDDGNSIPLTIKDIPSEEDWIVFNIGLSGLYKVQYDQRNWDLLIKLLTGPDFKDIGVMNRAHIVADSLHLAWSGEQDYDVALRLVEYLSQEKEYIPWKAALKTLSDVRRMLKRTSQYGFFKEYMQKLLRPIFKSQGGLNVKRKPNASQDVVKFKILISSWACSVDIEECTTKARKWFKEWKSTPQKNPIPSDLRGIVYCHAIRLGDERDWTFLLSQYRNSTVPTEKQTMLSALGCSRDVWILARYLEWSLSEDTGIRKQDSHRVFSSVAYNDIGFPLAKSFFEDRIEEIYEYLKPDQAIKRFITPLANSMTSSKEYDEFQELVKSRSDIFSHFEQTVQLSLETVIVNKQWQDKNFKSIGPLLAKRTASIQ